MKHTKRFLAIMVLIIFCAVQLGASADKHIGVFFGGNYFAKTERPGYKMYNGNPYTYGYYILDENGFSAHAGLIGYLSDKLSVEAKYRFPRFTSSVYASTYTAFVTGNNSYFTQTMTTSWTAELRYHLDKAGIADPYIGVGLDLFRVEAYNSVGFVNPITYYFEKYPEDYLGVRHVVGLIIPVGVTLDITKRIKVDANMNYTLMRLKEWGNEFPLADDQNFGGFYFNLNLVYNIW